MARTIQIKHIRELYIRMLSQHHIRIKNEARKERKTKKTKKRMERMKRKPVPTLPALNLPFNVENVTDGKMDKIPKAEKEIQNKEYKL